MFGRFKADKSSLVWLEDNEEDPEVPQGHITDPNTGVTVDASCNTTITIKCLQEMYSAVGYKPSSDRNTIGITGYLEQYANMHDLQLFYADQRPDALNTSFKFVSVHGEYQLLRSEIFVINIFCSLGGLNSQNLSEAGTEADLDVQFAFGLSFPIPVSPIHSL